jgi:hypothetical protein
MIHRIAVLCLLLLGFSLPVTLISCGYTSNFRGPEQSVVTPMNLFPLTVGIPDSRRLARGVAATSGLTMGY